jgi:tetratricopeptide (TPR) repeat protein
MSMNPYESPKEPPAPGDVRLSFHSVIRSRRLGRNIVLCGAPLVSVAILLFTLPRNWSEQVLRAARLPLLDPADVDTLAAVCLLTGLTLAVLGGYWLWRRQVMKPLRALCGLILDDPSVAEHYVARGTLYLDETMEMERAMNDFSKAIELAPHRWKAYALRGKAHWSCKRCEPAIADLTQAVLVASDAEELTPELWWLFDLRSAAHSQLQEYERAIADASEAIRLLMERGVSREGLALAALYYRRAMCRQQSGDAESAGEDFANAHRIDHFAQHDPRPGRRLLGFFGHLVFELVLYAVIVGLIIGGAWVVRIWLR